MLVLKYSPDFAISEARRELKYTFVPHVRLFATKALNSLFFITMIKVHTAMKGTLTLCELLILIICMCIVLFRFKSFFLSLLLVCFPAVLTHFVRHFPKARGRFYFFYCPMFYFGEIRVRTFLPSHSFPPKCCHSTDCFFVPGLFSMFPDFSPLKSVSN